MEFRACGNTVRLRMNVSYRVKNVSFIYLVSLYPASYIFSPQVSNIESSLDDDVVCVFLLKKITGRIYGPFQCLSFTVHFTNLNTVCS